MTVTLCPTKRRRLLQGLNATLLLGMSYYLHHATDVLLIFPGGSGMCKTNRNDDIEQHRSRADEAEYAYIRQSLRAHASVIDFI